MLRALSKIPTAGGVVVFVLAVLLVLVLSPAGSGRVTHKPKPAQERCTKELRKACQFGSSAGVARGDFNGDQIADLAIGVPFEDIIVRGATPAENVNVVDAGAVQVIYGSADGLAATAADAVIPSQLWHQNQGGVEDSVQEHDHFGFALASGDLNGDGKSDLAVAVPREDTTTGGAHDGAVEILFGSDTGLTADGDVILRPAALGVSNVFESPTTSSLAWGKFDGDAFGDLVIGAPLATVGSASGAGRVQVVYGSATGPNTGRVQTWTQGTAGVNDLEGAETGDNFGERLTAGDFDGDGRSDLAIASPNEDFSTLPDVGVVNVLYGTSSATGLTTTGNDLWWQKEVGLKGSVSEFDRFGRALGAGDFNGDGEDDLAIGVPAEIVPGVGRAGAVSVIYGSPSGLSPSATLPDQLWHQDSVVYGSEIEDAAVLGENFGVAVAAGDFNGDGRKDLAVGVPFEEVGGFGAAGAVNVIYSGGSAGLSASGDELFDQDRSGIEDEAAASEFFGLTLSAWNFGNGSQADLAVGVHGQDVAGRFDAGLVNVIYGSSGSGLTADGDQAWTQDSEGVPDGAESNDGFGRALD